jgi:hypothetical protein
MKGHSVGGVELRLMRRAAVSLVMVLAAAVFVAPGQAAPRRTPIVPSLTPNATAKLWRQLVAHPHRFNARQQANCRPLRGVFYAQTDWLRLATRLAAAPSPCAQYYVSVPPLAASKITLRNGQAALIRALGANFHALAELNWTAWSQWVKAGNGSWFDAGVEFRKRMAAAGFDVTAGDTWAVNEFPSTVRSTAGADRQAARDLVRGLFTGDGTLPQVKGVVWIVGLGQALTDTTLYQTNLQNWMGDSGFWTDMSAYVSDWSQEVYPDWRKTAVPGSTTQQRRDSLIDYLEHEIVLARVAPPAIQPASAFIQQTYSPLASAAWSWASGYGYSAIPYDQMQSFVSLQVYALRAYSVSTGQAQDHWGFGWAPRNPGGLSANDFAGHTQAILDRMAAAIRDSAALSNPSDPGVEACTNTCAGDYPGATFTGVWQSFRTWTQPLLSFTTPPQTVAAGAPSAAMNLVLLNATGAQQPAQAPLTITLGSSSPRGQFSLAPTGPFTPTLQLSIAQGGTAAGPFYYTDTRAGSETITAAAGGVVSATQSETILPGVPVSMKVTTTAHTVAALGSATLNAVGTDQYGNAVPVSAAWTLQPATLGIMRPATGATVAFVAGAKGGSGTITATGAGFTASTPIAVAPGPVHVASIRYGLGAGKTILVTATVLDSRGRPVPGAHISVSIRHRGYPFFAGHGTTLGSGHKTFRVQHKKGCYVTKVLRLNANGYRWDRSTPVNRFCK